MTADSNQDDLWNTGSADDEFFPSDEQTADIFDDVSGAESIPVAAEVSDHAASAVEPAGFSPILNPAPSKAQPDGYVVLARKYRPQTFDDIVGQEGVQQALRGAIATGQVSHSYLFSGPRGTGKTSVARILAKALNCQKDGPRPDPCGRCSSCRSIITGSSLDVIEIDAASNTGVDNIRELKSGVVLAPFSRYKVYIVDEVHMLSNQAFNALLKTLEEPPPQVIFILATTELHKVPETIISRCQTFGFRRFSLDELKAQLGNIMEIEAASRGLSVSAGDREKILDLIARNAEGGMRDAQVTLDQVLVLSKGTIDFESVRRFLGMADTEALDSFILLINERNSRELLELIDQLVTEGQDLELFIKSVCEHMRDLLLIKCAGRETKMVNASEDRALELEKTAAGLPARFLVSAIDQFLKVVGEMKTSGQPRIVLELAILKLILPDPTSEIESISKRLSMLEEELKSGALSQSELAAPVQANHHNAPNLGFQVGSVAETVPVTSYIDNAMAVSPVEDKGTPAAGVAFAGPGQLAAGDADSMAEALASRLRSDSSLLYLTFEKVLCGQQFDGCTLTLFINGSNKMGFSQIMRPQNIETLKRTSRILFGSNIMLQLQAKELTLEQTSKPAAPADTSAGSITAPVFDLAVSSEIAASEAEPQFSEHLTEPAGEGPVKIYYPDEIREKAMLEIKDSEFQQMLSTDEALRDLVEKTKRVFGIEDSHVKFHRSALT